MAERDRILYLNHAAYIGGAEVALLNLLTSLDRTRFQPAVFAPPGELAQNLKELDVYWIYTYKSRTCT